MLHIVKWAQRHYGDQSSFVLVEVAALVAAALMVGIALLMLQ